MNNIPPITDSVTPLQRDVAADLERQIFEWRQAVLNRFPPRLRALAAIARRAVNAQNLTKLERWCRKHGIPIEHRLVPLFRDFLITQLLELKDLEPDARARLRQHWLAQQDLSQATDDYLAGVRAGDDLRCRDCQWFVRAPGNNNSSDPSPGKSCVELGTKGADAACVGFLGNRANGNSMADESEQ